MAAGMPPQYPVGHIYQKLYQEYPHIKRECITIYTKNGVLMQPNMTLGNYNISPQNYEVIAAIPLYMFGSHGIVKLMKVTGYWEYDEDMVENLEIEELYEAELKNYNGNKRKAMTASVVSFLEVNYVEEYDELKLII